MNALKGRLLQEQNIKGKAEYNVRLYEAESEPGVYWISFSGGGTRLEEYEFSDLDSALEDYRTICDTVRSVISIEKDAQ